MKHVLTPVQPISELQRAGGPRKQQLSLIFSHLASALTLAAQTVAEVSQPLQTRRKFAPIPLLVHAPQKSPGFSSRSVRR